MGKEYREIEYTVKEADGKLTAGEIMRERLMLSSREVSRCKLFDDGVMCKGMLVRIISELEPGDVLTVRLYEDIENSSEIVPSDEPIDVVYEDEDLILLNKKGDQVVHPSYAHYKDSLSNALAGYYVRTGQEHVMRVIGRLDRETSGLIIFAKNRHSASILSRKNENMSRRKEYLALCSGIFDEKEGVIGLIANNFAKKYHKPTIIFALDASGEAYKGSCRAPKGFNVVDAFNQLDQFMMASGGHASAGGCSVKVSDFEAFKEAFIALAEKGEIVEEEEVAIPLYINEISRENYDIVESFSPFGESWPSPRFKLSRIRTLSLMYSRDYQHILTSIGNSARLTGFNFAKEEMQKMPYVDMFGTLRLSTYFNKTTVEFLISDICESKK